MKNTNHSENRPLDHFVWVADPAARAGFRIERAQPVWAPRLAIIAFHGPIRFERGIYRGVKR